MRFNGINIPDEDGLDESLNEYYGEYRINDYDTISELAYSIIDELFGEPENINSKEELAAALHDELGCNCNDYTIDDVVNDIWENDCYPNSITSEDNVDECLSENLDDIINSTRNKYNKFKNDHTRFSRHTKEYNYVRTLAKNIVNKIGSNPAQLLTIINKYMSDDDFCELLEHVCDDLDIDYNYDEFTLNR